MGDLRTSLRFEITVQDFNPEGASLGLLGRLDNLELFLAIQCLPLVFLVQGPDK